MSIDRVRPEIHAGGFARDDGTIEFFLRLRALVDETSTVLDLGAGRGAQVIDNQSQFRGDLINMKGKVRKLVGADVDPVVKENPTLDEAVVIKPNEPLPFEDGSFDLVFSDWVLEHIEDPEYFSAEVGRILKPGGWFCARTPYKYAYFALGARLLPDKAEAKTLSMVQPGRKSMDVFPKYYCSNTRKDISRSFPDSKWRTIAYYDNPPPSYTGNSQMLFRLLELYQKILPSVLLIYAQKL